MTNEQQDESQRVAFWTIGVLVSILLLVVVGSVVYKQLASARSPALELRVVEEEVLVELPLSGEPVATVFFAVADFQLPAQAAPELAKVVDALAQSAGRRALIAGFHDASGDASKNAALAKSRAQAARDALKAAGIDASRLQLRKPESTLAGGPAEQARRVEIHLID